jgi:hemerythrin-like metal-binding protein
MSSPTWDDSMKTGDTHIDEQHRHVLDLVDKLEAAESQTHSPTPTLYSILDELMAFTETHFMAEEHLMRRVEYPAIPMEEMLAQHAEFKNYARLRVLEFRHADDVSVLPMLSYLTEWLVNHEFGLDRMLVDWIRENQPGHLT